MTQDVKKDTAKEPKAMEVRRPRSLMSRVERDFERMIEEFWNRPISTWPWRWLPRGVGVPVPVLDVYEEKDDIVVKAELPGISKEAIQVNLTNSTLTVKGEKKKHEEIKEEDYAYQERSYGAFTRTVDLPSEVKTEQVRATFKDGVLEIRLPKTEEAKKQSLSVKIE